MERLWSKDPDERIAQLILIDSLIALFAAAFVMFFYKCCLEMADGEMEFISERIMLFFMCNVLSRILMGIYRSVWRYANIYSYSRLVVADIVSGIAYLVIDHFCGEWNMNVIYICSVVLVCDLATLVTRFLYQSMRYGSYLLMKPKEVQDRRELNKINIAIVGAGDTGANLAEDLRRNPHSLYRPICFIDKKYSQDTNINGIRVYREDGNIVETIKNLPVQEIVFALNLDDTDKKNDLFQLYSQTGCRLRVYDYPEKVIGSDPQQEQTKTIRDISIEDVLFREPITVNNAITKEFYHDKVILISGGGGSIGSGLCRTIAELMPKRLIILDIYENNAYDIQQELVRKYGKSLHLDVVIASVRDAKRLDEIFEEYKPEIVFHAAAHKHVPLMEDSGCEAIKNNVFGTYNMANVAEKHGVKRFVLISTDKAVNPTNIMGASKRLCEMVVRCRKDSKTDFAAVRFGNVLGSNGSVIPLFKRQIEKGGPVTITDKRIIRYFMTIPEACGLVMEAGAMAKKGDLFVLDMGKPVKILDLAENMIRLCGLRPYQDIDIVEIGLRPGEKLYEELLMNSDTLTKTPNNLIFIEKEDSLTREEVEKKLQILRTAVMVQTSAEPKELAKRGYHDIVLKSIKEIVPTFHDPEEVNQKVLEEGAMPVLSGEKPQIATAS